MTRKVLAAFLVGAVAIAALMALPQRFTPSSGQGLLNAPDAGGQRPDRAGAAE